MTPAIAKRIAAANLPLTLLNPDQRLNGCRRSRIPGKRRRSLYRVLAREGLAVLAPVAINRYGTAVMACGIL